MNRIESIPVWELRVGVENSKLTLRWHGNYNYISSQAMDQLVRHIIQTDGRSEVVAASGPIADFLLKMPATLVAQNLNHQLANYFGRTTAELELAHLSKGTTVKNIKFKIGGGTNGGRG